VSDDLDRASGDAGPYRIDVSPGTVPCTPGEPALLVVEVTNTSDVIRQATLAVVGVDPSWVTIDQSALPLFPDERAATVVQVTLPVGFPAGRRRMGIEVGDATDPLGVGVVEVDLLVAEDPKVEVRIEPGTIITGRRAVFTATVVNKGNADLDVGLRATDPEAVLETTFLPAALMLHPGGEAVVRVDVRGKRPLVGAPGVRAMTVEANGHLAGRAAAAADARAAAAAAAEAAAAAAPAAPTAPAAPGAGVAAPVAEEAPPPAAMDFAMATVVQRPWISRKLFSIGGLLAAATVLALVFTFSFGSVADVAKANEDLLKQSLGADEAAADRVAPSNVSGQVRSATGAGIDGVVIELFDAASSAPLPTRATVTDQSGSFTLAGVPEGIYRLKVTAAGFGERWFPAAATFEDGQDLAVEKGKSIDGLVVELAGLPASIAGSVLGDDVAGAVVTVQVPGGTTSTGSVDGTPLATGGGLVRQITVDASGTFEVGDLPTPATYEVIATMPGLASELRTVRVQPGDRLTGVTLLLRAGDGVIAGRVTNPDGVPVTGATVAVSSGTVSMTTLTLSGAPETAGTFEVRDLQTPGTFSLSVTAPGHFGENQTIKLDAQQSIRELEIVLVPSEGRIGGRVTNAAGAPLGGATVTVIGPGSTRTTASLSNGDVGSWLVTGLTVPGSYTVTFSGEGLASQTLAVLLTPITPARPDVDVTLTSSVATVQGTVRELGAPADPPTCVPDDNVLDDCPGRLSGVQVVLSSAIVNKRTITADVPTGAFRFDGLPPGAYTVSFSRVGSTPQTLFVELAAGERRTVADVVLEPQARISGTVTGDGLPMPNVGVRVFRLGDYPNVVTATAVTNQNGIFSVIGLDAPETYVVEYQVPAGGPVQASQQVFLRPGSVGNGDVEL
jgi:hypothetical protein